MIGYPRSSPYLGNLRLKLKANNSVETNSSEPASIMSVTSRRILELLRTDAPTGLDNLIESVQGSSSSEIIADLFELELDGQVRQLPGKSYIRVWAE